MDAELTSAEIVPDPVLLAARDQARAALEEITDAASIGAEAGFEVHAENLVTLFFDCTLAGYPGWRWAAALTRVDEDSAVNVLEVEMLPGENSVVAPEWVPWSERLAQYRDAQAQQRHADELADAEDAASELADEDESDDDVMDNDYSDFDDEINGVNVDDDYDEDDSDDDDSVDDDSDDDASEDFGVEDSNDDDTDDDDTDDDDSDDDSEDEE